MRVIDRKELVAWASQLTPSPAVGILLAGDRLGCIDEAIAVEADGKIVGVATIAPEGEEFSGQPTIVALYVLHEHRRRGFGRQLLVSAIKRCRERGLIPVRIDALSSKIGKITSSLPDELKEKIQVVDVGLSMDIILDQ